MEKLKKVLPFYCVILLDFYIVPFLMRDTGSAMFILLIIMPFICLVTSICYGIKNGFHFWFALIVALLFIPSIFIFYNSSAWIYIVVFGILALLGNIIAVPFYKSKRNR